MQDSENGNRRLWSRAEIITALQDWAAEHGRTPTFQDFDPAPPNCPGRQTVVNRFGKWRDGIRAAGLEPVPPGHGPGRPRKNDKKKRSAPRSTGRTAQAL